MMKTARESRQRRFSLEVGDYLKHYTRPSKETYLQYHTNATRLLLDVSEYCKVHVSATNI